MNADGTGAEYATLRSTILSRARVRVLKIAQRSSAGTPANDCSSSSKVAVSSASPRTLARRHVQRLVVPSTIIDVGFDPLFRRNDAPGDDEKVRLVDIRPHLQE